MLAVGCGARSSLHDFGSAGSVSGGNAAAGSGSTDTTSGGSAASGASGGAGSGSGSGTASGVSTGTAGASADASTGSNESGASDAGALPPSCQPGGPGMTNCGARGENCCTSLEVTGSTYYRTYDPWGFTEAGAYLAVVLAADGGPTGEADPATVSTFRLDKYDVTVGRFRQFVNAVSPPDGGAGWLPSAGSGKHTHLNDGQGLMNVGDDAGVAYEPGWLASDDSNIAPTNANLSGGANSDCTWTNTAGSQENLPINCVTWQESYAFCIWDGGFLPSEAEWEYGAAGGSRQREYPWGSTDPGTANQYAIYGYWPPRDVPRCYYPSGTTCTGVANIAPVGTATLGAGLWGQLDLVGDVFEWNLDWYAGYVDPCTDCGNFTASSDRAIRGGAFLYGTSDLFPWTRTMSPPTERLTFVGLRCARAP
jgi:sulfatase modifying factor 1